MKTTKYGLVAALGLLALAAPRAARADEIYQFNVGASGGISAFSFSFTAPSFVANNVFFLIPPFTITNGTTTWTLDNGLATTAQTGVGCFMFAGNGGDIFASPPSCSSGSVSVRGGTPGNSAALSFGLPGPLPTTTGTFSLGGGASVLCSSGTTACSTTYVPSGTLIISNAPSPVPEPSSLILLGTGLLGLLGAARRMRLT